MTLTDLHARVNHYADGKEVAGEPETVITVLAPVHSDGQFIFPCADAALVSEAVAVATRAFTAWSALQSNERADHPRAAIRGFEGEPGRNHPCSVVRDG